VDVAVVGAGRVGTAVAVLLREAGHRIVALSGRDETESRAGRYLPGVPVTDAASAARDAELVILGVPDDAIAPTAERLAKDGALHEGQWVAHLAGASGLDELAAVGATGARAFAIHPLQTLPDVDRALERIPGSTIAVTAHDEEGYALGERLAHDLRGKPFRLADERRPLYHAAAVFASNDLIATVALGEQLFGAAGVPDPHGATVALVRATVDNLAAMGPEAALTGPAVRGDAGTIAKNLEALRRSAPAAIPAYVQLARVALDLAVRGGRLHEDGRARVEEVLARWT
jgi:predicted short-subunit dehydrogenase-like oxidoreductase (DUF2520 family)